MSSYNSTVYIHLSLKDYRTRYEPITIYLSLVSKPGVKKDPLEYELYSCRLLSYSMAIMVVFFRIQWPSILLLQPQSLVNIILCTADLQYSSKISSYCRLLYRNSGSSFFQFVAVDVRCRKLSWTVDLMKWEPQNCRLIKRLRADKSECVCACPGMLRHHAGSRAVPQRAPLLRGVQAAIGEVS